MGYDKLKFDNAPAMDNMTTENIEWYSNNHMFDFRMFCIDIAFSIMLLIVIYCLMICFSQNLQVFE